VAVRNFEERGDAGRYVTAGLSAKRVFDTTDRLFICGLRLGEAKLRFDPASGLIACVGEVCALWRAPA
jgi:hypothetical protein